MIRCYRSGNSFSALQRAENSSIKPAGVRPRDLEFQCSSASRKFLNQTAALLLYPDRPFQCSSASRKFLNRRGERIFRVRVGSFSALQRAENSSIDE